MNKDDDPALLALTQPQLKRLNDVLAEIKKTPWTDDALPDPEDTPEIAGIIEDYFYQLQSPTPQLLSHLKKLCKTYPHFPKFRNHLAVAYQAMGKLKQSEKVDQQTFLDFPDYLFARSNEIRRRLDDGHLDGARELLGESRSLHALYPERDLFHLTEVRGYYESVARVYFAEGENMIALKLAQELIHLDSHPHPGLEQLITQIGLANMQQGFAKQKADMERQIHVSEPAEPKTSSASERPRLHHEELTILYQRGYDIPPETIKTLLALPRKSLIADLEKILLDAFTRTKYFRKLAKRDDYSDEFYPALHTVFFLGELRAHESLPTVLKVLSHPTSMLEFWFGQELYSELWEGLYGIVGEQISEVENWLLEPGRSPDARLALIEVLERLAKQADGPKDEALEALVRLFYQLLDSPPEANVYATRVANALVSAVLDFNLIEHREALERFTQREDYQVTYFGTSEHLLEDLVATRKRPRRATAPRPLATLYKDLGAHGSMAQMPSAEGITDELITNHPESPLAQLFQAQQKTTPAPSREKVGRNDPCPCGSGKKYKKCCV